MIAEIPDFNFRDEEEQADIDLGTQCAKEQTGPISHGELAKRVYHRIDFNRFDYEDGERALLEAVVLTTYAFLQAGGQFLPPGRDTTNPT